MKLSIIIPTVGRETLAEVLQGIRACDGFEEIKPEVIVVFDGVGTCHGMSLPKIKILETGKASGASVARNIGIENATGDVIAFLGDDTIPTKNWLREIYNFHTQHADENVVLLGKVSWTEKLSKDSFHQWLLNHAQFDYKNIKKHGPTWRHFYTSNISLKKSFIGKTKFPEDFEGWGFEDIAFGYELAQKDMWMWYDEKCEVLHDHEQTLEQVIKNTRNARKNAEKFEKKYDMKILPRGGKLWLLKFALFLTLFFAPFSKKLRWWRAWKKAWI